MGVASKREVGSSCVMGIRMVDDDVDNGVGWPEPDGLSYIMCCWSLM